MEIPATPFHVGVFLVMVLPGIVYSAVRTPLTGQRGHDRDIADRILQALFVSTLLDVTYLSAYVLIHGDQATVMLADPRTRVLEHLREVALGLLVLGIFVPAGLAFLIHGSLTWKPVSRRRGLRWLKLPNGQRSTFQSTPTAWDKVAPNRGGRWVRVRMGEATWVGGWIGGNSYVSTYPEPHDLFIEDQHHINALGEFGERVENSAGVWISLPEGAIVEWIDPDPI